MLPLQTWSAISNEMPASNVANLGAVTSGAVVDDHKGRSQCVRVATSFPFPRSLGAPSHHGRQQPQEQHPFSLRREVAAQIAEVETPANMTLNSTNTMLNATGFSVKSPNKSHGTDVLSSQLSPIEHAANRTIKSPRWDGGKEWASPWEWWEHTRSQRLTTEGSTPTPSDGTGGPVKQHTAADSDGEYLPGVLGIVFSNNERFPISTTHEDSAYGEKVRVVGMVPNSPAMLSQSLHIGDIVVSVDGVEIIPTMSSEQLRDACAGPIGSSCTIIVDSLMNDHTVRRVVTLVRGVPPMSYDSNNESIKVTSTIAGNNADHDDGVGEDEDSQLSVYPLPVLPPTSNSRSDARQCDNSQNMTTNDRGVPVSECARVPVFDNVFIEEDDKVGDDSGQARPLQDQDRRNRISNHETRGPMFCGSIFKAADAKYSYQTNPTFLPSPKQIQEWEQQRRSQQQEFSQNTPTSIEDEKQRRKHDLPDIDVRCDSSRSPTRSSYDRLIVFGDNDNSNPSSDKNHNENDLASHRTAASSPSRISNSPRRSPQLRSLSPTSARSDARHFGSGGSVGRGGGAIGKNRSQSPASRTERNHVGDSWGGGDSWRTFETQATHRTQASEDRQTAETGSTVIAFPARRNAHSYRHGAFANDEGSDGVGNSRNVAGGQTVHTANGNGRSPWRQRGNSGQELSMYDNRNHDANVFSQAPQPPYVTYDVEMTEHDFVIKAEKAAASAEREVSILIRRLRHAEAQLQHQHRATKEAQKEADEHADHAKRARQAAIDVRSQASSESISLQNQLAALRNETRKKVTETQSELKRTREELQLWKEEATDAKQQLKVSANLPTALAGLHLRAEEASSRCHALETRLAASESQSAASKQKSDAKIAQLVEMLDRSNAGASDRERKLSEELQSVEARYESVVSRLQDHIQRLQSALERERFLRKRAETMVIALRKQISELLAQVRISSATATQERKRREAAEAHAAETNKTCDRLMSYLRVAAHANDYNARGGGVAYRRDVLFNNVSEKRHEDPRQSHEQSQGSKSLKSHRTPDRNVRYFAM